MTNSWDPAMDETRKSLYKLISLPFEVKDDVGQLEVSYPGFFIDDFIELDKIGYTGVIIPEKFAKLMESSRALNRLLPPLNRLSRIGHTLVIVSMDYYLQPELHYLTDMKVFFPFKIATSVSNMGASSFVMKQVLYKDNIERPLATCYCKCVYIDWHTRRPVRIPDAIRQSVHQQEAHRDRVSIPPIPSIRYRYEVEIRSTDIDSNLHSNQAVYVRLCSDAAAIAEENSFYRGIRNIANHHLSEMRTLYAGESFEGDKLAVFTWQHSEENNVIYFVIVKENEPIFYCHWKVFLPQTKAVL